VNKILDAVKQLDGTNDNHWTADGLPRLETVRMLASDPSLSREQVEEAAPGFKRPKPEAAAPTPPAAPAAPAAAETPAAPAAGEAPEQDSGVRGDLGPATPAMPASTPSLAEEAAVGGPVPPEDVDGQALPQPEPLPTAPAADGLPTANEPTATEGAEPVGLNVDDVSGRSGPDGEQIPEIAEGTTTQGFNAMNSEEDDVRDALASVAPSPNAPTTLGGPLQPDELAGINADGLSVAADALGEVPIRSIDHGVPGDPEAVDGLRKDLEAAEGRSAKLRAQADKITGQLNEAAAEESRIRAAIEAATPRTGTMEAIQGYFAAQDRRAEEVATARQTIFESGVDLKALGRLTQRTALDAAAANKK
jgi:hypothetical protein